MDRRWMDEGGTLKIRKDCNTLLTCVCREEKEKTQKQQSWYSPPRLHLAQPVWAAINFYANHRGLGMNGGTVFKLCARTCALTFAGTSRDKAPSAHSRPSWLPAPLARPERMLSVSIVTKPTLPLRLLLRCLLVLTANNVLLDDCAVLEPERRDGD